MKTFYCAFFTTIFLALFSYTETLKERFLVAEKGSYIVFENQNILSCLVLHSIKDNRLFLYEISIPASQLTTHSSFKKWLTSHPRDYSAFVLYSINLLTDEVEKCFSFISHSYIQLSDQNTFLPQLLNLNLSKVSDKERKKLCPKAGLITEDQNFWNPPKIVDGDIISQRSFDVLKTTWPSDNSELSLKPITLYFDKDNPCFPFPYWIEIGDSPISHKLRAKDSGILETLPFDFFPKKPLEILSVHQDSQLCIILSHDESVKKFHILATSSYGKTHLTHLLDHEIVEKDGLTHLIISQKTLENTLVKDCPYHLCIFPEQDPTQCIELKELVQR